MSFLTKFVKNNLYFILILFIGIVLRFYKVSDVPPSLNWDEISHGYNAYSILKTGRDEWGDFLPIIFRAYGDYKLPVYIYLTTLSEFVFGLTPFAVRLTSALAGSSAILATYLLVKLLFNKKIAIYTCLLVALEPWSLFLSRGAFEANLSFAFITWAVYFFFRACSPQGKSQEKNSFLVVSSLLFGLSVWTYNSARVFVPIFIIGLVLLYKNNLFEIYRTNRKVIRYSFLVMSLFFLPMFIQLLNPSGKARYANVGIIDEGAVAKINEARVSSNLPVSLKRLVHNRPVYFVKEFGKNYVSHFLPSYLFVKGGSHYQFSVPGHGQLYLVNAIFFYMGLFLIVRTRKDSYNLLLLWLLIAPIPDSLTREAPHVLRSLVMLPIPMIVTALGLSFFLRKISRKTVLQTAYTIILLIFVENFLANYFDSYAKNYSWSWQYGYRQVVNYVRDNYDNYAKIIVTKKYGEPHEFFLFYWPWDPGKYQKDPKLVRFYQSGWYWVDGFDKFYFVNDWQIKDAENRTTFTLESGGKVDCKNPKCLLITSPGNFPEGWKKVNSVYFLNGETAFELYENF